MLYLRKGHKWYYGPKSEEYRETLEIEGDDVTFSRRPCPSMRSVMIYVEDGVGTNQVNEGIAALLTGLSVPIPQGGQNGGQ